jgi:hypothetical protein
MRLVIIGAGFAGMYAALSAARLRDIQGVSPEELEIALVAPEPTLVVRPRLYEPKPETLTAPLLDVLRAIDVVYVQGSAETIDSKSRTVGIVAAKGTKKSLSYDRLVVATGSRLFRPNIPGLTEHGFSVDSLDDAIALDKHLHSLAKRPAVNGRDTVVVAGGGFTGIEAATGSLGHGLPMGLGMALAGRIQGLGYNVIALSSDGECNEGSVWEAAMFAASQKVERLCVVVDCNRWQATGRTADIAGRPFGARSRHVAGGVSITLCRPCPLAEVTTPVGSLLSFAG